MKKLSLKLMFFLVLCIKPFLSYAILSLELTHGSTGSIPIAILPFTFDSDLSLRTIVANDLKNSGKFTVDNHVSLPESQKNDPKSLFRKLSVDALITGDVKTQGNQNQVHFSLFDIYKEGEAGKPSLEMTIRFNSGQYREVAHRISDLIYERLTGEKGIFSTKLAYILIQSTPLHKKHYILEVADQDGFNPRALLNSMEPIMSPAWSPDGKKLAYVSFEKKKASIYVQTISSGERQLISAFPGINGAPAWSPDGNKLALVLSKNGSPNIYSMELNTRRLTQLTDDYYINTEPTWSKDGIHILFTSNRSGKPQVYQMDLKSKKITRVTFDGDYNARPFFTQDGKSIALMHRVAGLYNIALLNLDKGTLRVLTPTNSGDSSSPAVAPNGSMVLYDTVDQGKNVLAMVSIDGHIRLRLPSREGEVQDPAWSPFMR